MHGLTRPSAMTSLEKFKQIGTFSRIRASEVNSELFQLITKDPDVTIKCLIKPSNDDFYDY
jgi:hypothetical protein